MKSPTFSNLSRLSGVSLVAINAMKQSRTKQVSLLTLDNLRRAEMRPRRRRVFPTLAVSGLSNLPCRT
jgi:hypothetical protein